MSVVYFIGGSLARLEVVKIGFTSGAIASRVASIRTASPIEIEIYGYVEGGRDLERKFHETFAPVRMHGEWFHADGKLWDFIHYLDGYGGAARPTTVDELDCAVHDCIMADCAPHPNWDDDAYLGTANTTPWAGIYA